MKIWKIKNTSHVNVPVAVAMSSNASKGVLLEPGQFCLGEGRLTASLDAQTRRRFIEIVEKDYDNSISELKFGQAYEDNHIQAADENTTSFVNKG